ncbi:MAG: hypothetical protein V3U72_04395 [Candidatus Aenigmarchaeota archaeon]
MDYKNRKWEYGKIDNYDAIEFFIGKSLCGTISPIYRNERGEIIVEQAKFLFLRNGTGDTSFIFEAIQKAEGLKKKDREVLSKVKKMIEKNEIPLIESGDLYSF